MKKRSTFNTGLFLELMVASAGGAFVFYTVGGALFIGLSILFTVATVGFGAGALFSFINIQKQPKNELTVKNEPIIQKKYDATYNKLTGLQQNPPISTNQINPKLQQSAIFETDAKNLISTPRVKQELKDKRIGFFNYVKYLFRSERVEQTISQRKIIK